MIRLNKVRVNLKHQGQSINKSDIEAFRVNSKDFFEDNTPIVFGIDFSEISLIDLIENDEVKQILKDAQNFSSNNNYKESIERLAIAFNVLISDYEKSKTRYRRSPFLIGENSRFIWTPDLNSDHREIVKSLKEIQEIIKLLCLDIDCRKYEKFRLLTPIIFRGKEIYDKYNTFWLNIKERKFNEEQVDFCFNFIIESALKLQEFDFEIENI